MSDAKGPPPEFDYATQTPARMLSRLGKHSLLFGLSTVVSKIGGFLLIPIFWSRIQPGEYGIYGITEMVVLFVGPLMTMSLGEALMRFYFEWPEHERKDRTGDLWSLFVVNALLWWTLLHFLGPIVWPSLIRQVPFHPYIDIALANALFQGFHTMFFVLWRIRERVPLYIVSNLMLFFVSAGLSIYLVVVEGMGILGILYASMITNGVWACASVLLMMRECRFHIRWKESVSCVRYALPLAPTAVLFFIPRIFDRFFLEKYVSLVQLGLYSVGAQFGNILQTALSSLKNAWLPMVLRVGIERPDAPRLLARFSKYYILTFLTIGLGVAMLSKEFVLFASAQYAGANNFIPLLVLLNFLSTFDMLLGTGFLITKITRYAPPLQVLELTLTLGLLMVLTGTYGVYGAIAALLATRVIMIMARFSIVQRIYPIPFEYVTLGVLHLMAGAVFTVSFLLPSMPLWASAAIKLALLLGFVAVSVMFFLEGREGLTWVKQLWSREAEGKSPVP